MIRPLFPFYGSKWRDARRYPAPGESIVIEPFAGSACYSLWHEPHRVWLYDVDPIVVGVWRYLIAVTPREILALPDLEPGQSTDELALPQEARWLIAADVPKIRHWRVTEASYEGAPRRDDATYFVDPPYVVKGRHYRCNHVDHAAIGAWVRALPGRVIACENVGADWLPFRSLASIKSTRGRSDEAVYLQGCGGIDLAAFGP